MDNPRLLLSALLTLLSLSVPAAAETPDVSLQSDTDVATAGYYRLYWETTDAPSTLVEATDPDFESRREVYSGPDAARLVSGKPDGDYYYRLESADGSAPRVLSNTVKVTVTHHPLQRAFLFFAIGATVFAATLALILVGSRAERSES